MKVVQAPGTEATSSRGSQKTSEGCGLSGETRTERYLASVPWHSGARSQLSIVWTLHFAPVAGQDAGKEGSFPSGQLCPGTEALGADANNAHAKPRASIPWGKTSGGAQQHQAPAGHCLYLRQHTPQVKLPSPHSNCVCKMCVTLDFCWRQRSPS